MCVSMCEGLHVSGGFAGKTGGLQGGAAFYCSMPCSR